MKELGRVTFSSDTTSGGERERENIAHTELHTTTHAMRVSQVDFGVLCIKQNKVRMCASVHVIVGIVACV